MAIPPSGKTEMIAANRARAAANRNTNGKKAPPTKRKGGVEKNDKTLRYPYAMLRDNTDYLEIKIADYKPPGLNLENGITAKDASENNVTKDTKIKSIDINKGFLNFAAQTGTSENRKSLKNPKQIIYLPIPQQLSDTTSVNWDSGGLNAIEAFGVSAAGAIMNSGGVEEGFDVAKSAVNKLIEGAKFGAQNSQIRQAITAALAGQAIGALGGNVSGSQLVSRATGQVFNPNLELLFEGVNLRTFPFTFDFFPRNLEEADQVKRIIRSLKMSMSARKTGTASIFISAPDVFQLTYKKGNKPHPFLNTFLPMALTSVNLSYTGSNTYSTFHDGTPTHIRMELTFKELNPVYFEDYTDDIPGVGY